MARKLMGQEAGPATLERPAETVSAGIEAGKKKREWLPYTGPECLPPAEYRDKKREYFRPDGQVMIRKEVVVKKGPERHLVTPDGELIAVYKKRGGTGRRLLWQFKRKYADSPEGKQRKAYDAQFRVMLRSKGIPGA